MIRWLKALFHIDLSAVCSLSGGWIEYHTYHDSDEGFPECDEHLFCRRCGKGFYA